MDTLAANQSRRRTGLEEDNSDVAPTLENAKEPLFSYEPLNPDSLRLLTIEAALDEDDPVVCRMATVPFENRPRYEALSYRWGHPSGGEDFIILNGARFPVRRNLFDGLRYLRRLSRSLPTWIDAICINQYDIPERNRQLRIMRHIYMRAATVIVWLGARYSVHDELIAKLRMCDSLATDEGLDVPNQHEHDCASENRLLNDLSTDEYWHRVWIIQEIGQARELLVCFGRSAPWEWERFIFLNITHNVGHSGPVRLDILRKGRFRGACTLRRLLEDHRAAICTDPRDKVYGLVGLAVDARHFPMDYTKSLVDVWMDAMHFVNAKKLVIGADLIDFGRLVNNLLHHGSEYSSLGSVLGRACASANPASPQSREQMAVGAFKMNGYLLGQVIHVGPSTDRLVSSLDDVDDWDETVQKYYKTEIEEAQEENWTLKSALLNSRERECLSYVSQGFGVTRRGSLVKDHFEPHVEFFPDDFHAPKDACGGDTTGVPRTFLLRNRYRTGLPWKMGITSWETKIGDMVVYVPGTPQAVIVRGVFLPEKCRLGLKVVGRAWLTEDIVEPNGDHAGRLRALRDMTLELQMDATSIYLLIS